MLNSAAVGHNDQSVRICMILISSSALDTHNGTNPSHTSPVVANSIQYSLLFRSGSVTACEPSGDMVLETLKAEHPEGRERSERNTEGTLFGSKHWLHRDEVQQSI